MSYTNTTWDQSAINAIFNTGYTPTQPIFVMDFNTKINSEISTTVVDFVTKYGTEKLKEILKREIEESKLRDENENLDKLYREYKTLAKRLK